MIAIDHACRVYVVPEQRLGRIALASDMVPVLTEQRIEATYSYPTLRIQPRFSEMQQRNQRGLR
jgi:hypothetical protein